MAVGGAHIQDALHSSRRLQERTRHAGRSDRKAEPHGEGGRCGEREEATSNLLIQGSEDDRAARGRQAPAGDLRERDRPEAVRTARDESHQRFRRPRTRHG